MEELNDYNEAEKSSFDLKAEIYKYLVHWKWLVFGLLIGGLSAYLYNRYSIPEYRTKATMMIVNQQEKNVMSAIPSGESSILSLEENGLGNHIETLKSISLTEDVVDELNLHISYYEEGDVITVQTYESTPIIINFFTPDSIINNLSKEIVLVPADENSYKLINEKTEEVSEVYEIGERVSYQGLDFSILPRFDVGSPVFERENPIIIEISPVREKTEEYLKDLEIKQKGKSKDILALALVEESSEKSKDYLNHLMMEFNEEGVKNKKEVAENTANFIQSRLEIITNELDSVETGMAEFKRENQIMDVVGGAGEFRSISAAAEKQIFSLETQLELIKSVEEMLNNQGKYELLPANIGIEEKGISALIGTYNQLVLERDAALKNSTEKNPVIQAYNDRLDSLKENLQENIQSAVNSINVKLAELNQRERQAEGVFSTFPGLEKGIRGIKRQQQIKEQLYLFLLQRREEAAISSAATADVVRIIDPAYTVEEPVSPQPWMIMVGGLLVGLLIPVIIIFVKNMLDTKIHHKKDLQQLTHEIPFVGEIPKIDKTQSDSIEKNDRSILAESFRILRTNLSYLSRDRKDKNKVMFVTSTVKGEGKTFIAYNLARTLAGSGDKVLLIGADIRNPQLHRYATSLNSSSKGLSDFLYDEQITLSEVVNKEKEGEIPVDIILSGRIPPNPAELLLSKRMDVLFEEVKSFYDYIVVDTAPTMLVTDTILINRYADTTIYLTRAGFTEKGLLDYAKEIYEEGKITGMALLVNDVDYSKLGYASKYGYAYSYSYGEEKKGFFQKIKEKITGKAA